MLRYQNEPSVYLWGSGGIWMTLLKKENSPDNADWTFKKLLKIISADIKVDVKQRVIKELV